LPAVISVPSPRVYRTEAIILRRADFGEADKVLTIYTPERGKVRVLAKGVARPTSKMGGHLETFTCSQLQVARGRNLDIVTQCETAHSFHLIREDLERTTMAFHVAEIMEHLAGEHIQNTPTYNLLLATLQRLDGEDSPDMAVRFFEMQLLEHMGYRPELRRCLRCQDQVRPVVNYFSPGAGGVLCPDCGRTSGGLEVSVNALKLLRVLQDGDYSLARRVQAGAPLRAELETTMRAYLQYVLERRLRSCELLTTVRQINLR
jgi:DNA repair protein RecO (recombination protein O)